MSKVFRYSAINTAHTCLRKYKHLYLDGLKEDVCSADMEFGSSMHLALQAHFEGDDPLATFNTSWGALRGKDMKYTRLGYDELQSRGEVFISRFQRLHAKNYEPLYVEQQLEVDLNGFAMQGTPDFVGNYKGKLSVVDFKTSSREYDKIKMLTNEQLYVYSHMAKVAYNLDIQQLVYCVFVKLPEPRIQVQTLELTPGKLTSMLDNVTQMMRDLSTRTEYPRNPNSCTYCPFMKLCYPED